MDEPPATGAKWGLAALLGCGACCGGLAATATWAGATTAAVAGLLSGWLWLAFAAVAVAAALLVWRRRG